jgi:hypothetical protein
METGKLRSERCVLSWAVRRDAANVLRFKSLIHPDPRANSCYANVSRIDRRYASPHKNAGWQPALRTGDVKPRHTSSIRKRLIKSIRILQFPSLQNRPAIQTLHILRIRILSNHLRPQVFASHGTGISRFRHLPQILALPTKSVAPLTNPANLSISHCAGEG